MKCPDCGDGYYKGNIITAFCQFCRGKKDLDWIECITGVEEDHSNFLSNIHLVDENEMLQASKNTGIFIYISYTAYNTIDRSFPVPNEIGIYLRDKINYEKIWNEFLRLVEIKYSDYQI